jgi:hypothetical protein
VYVLICSMAEVRGEDKEKFEVAADKANTLEVFSPCGAENKVATLYFDKFISKNINYT